MKDEPQVIVSTSKLKELEDTKRLAHSLRSRLDGLKLRRRPVWLRRGWWALARTRIAEISHADVDKLEYDQSFPVSNKLTKSKY